MAQSITLSAPIRSNLLTLQSTSSLIGRTENRLSTGLKVSSAIDDAVAYFQGKALSDRSSDFAEKKDGIDQGISSLTTAMTAISSIETIMKQMKGLVLSAKSSTAAEAKDLAAQFNTLSKNINTLASDATYQGMNLVAGTSAKLKVDFSTATAAYLEIKGVDLRGSKLITNKAASVMATGLAGELWSKAAVVTANAMTRFDNVIKKLDTALSKLRANSKALGSNIALLQTRLDFTKSYTNTLEEGSGKLTLADMNEEGANLVALQTRQSLGIQALQFSGQSEQAVLQLLR